MKLQLCYPCVMPFQISQRFGENYDYYFKYFKEKGHNGWDFSVPTGTPIYATHDGKVSFCQVDNFGSMSISIHTTDELYRTVYGHLSEFKVKLGDIVKKGQLIALSGNTGRYTTGPHLHFGVHGILNGLDTNVDNGFLGALDPALFWDGTYPNTDNSKIKAAKFALRDWQVSVGIMDFANETDYTKIKFGPKSQALFNK